MVRRATFPLDGKLVILVAALDNIGTTTTLASSVTLSSVVTLGAAVALFAMWLPSTMEASRQRRAEMPLVGRVVRDKSRALPKALWLWFAWAVLSLSWDVDRGKWALQNLCVYAGFMFAADLTARHASVEYGRKLFRALVWVAWLISLVYLFSVLRYGLGTTVVLRSRGTAIEDAILSGTAVLAWRGLRIPIARFLPIVLLGTVTLSLSRMSLAITMLALFTAFSVSGSRQQKGIMSKRTFMRLVGGVLAAGAVFTYLVYNWAPLHNRFIGGDKASVGGVQINTSGRLEIWSGLWHNAWSSMTHVIIGQGVASSELAVAAAFHINEVTQRQLADPHNDFLRMFFDFGIIGFVLFVVGMVQLATRIYRFAVEESDRTIRAMHWAAFIAACSLLGSMITDNPVVYSFCMFPFGALVGLSMGLARQRVKREELEHLKMQLLDLPEAPAPARPRILPSDT